MKKYFLLLTFAFISLSYSQKKLPNLSLKNLENKSLNTIQDFKEKDKIYVFSFWATWCAPCIQELDAINDVYEDWKKELNVEIIAVTVDDTRTSKRVNPLVNGKGWEYTILFDTNQDFKRAIGISNVPYLMAVKNGEIVYVQNGHSPGAEAELLEKLKSL